MKRVVLYLRVSSEEQVRGTSLDNQQSCCEDYCRRNDLQVIKIFREEGESAKSDNRPLFQEMLRFCAIKKNQIDHVLVYKLDRFARNSTDYHINVAALARSNTTVRSATEPIDDDPVGHLLETVLAGIAQFDNDIRGERSRLGMLQIAERGGWNFKAPLGYQQARLPDGLPIIEENPETGPAVRKLFEAIASGRCRASELPRYAVKLGLHSHNGSPLHPQTIYKMLRAEVYAGRIKGKLLGGRTVKAAFKPLISDELFDKVQSILQGYSHVPSPHLRHNPSFPLRGSIICSKCGHALTASFSTGRRGGKYGQYRCKNPKCKGVNVRMEVVEQAFLSLLANINIESTQFLQTFRQHILDEWKVRHAEAIAGQGLVKSRADQLIKQKESLLDKFVRGLVDDESYTKKNSELSRQIEELRYTYRSAAGEEFDIELVIKIAIRMIQNAGRLWYKLRTPENRQRLQQALFPNGLIYDQKTQFGTAVSTWPIRVLRGEIDPSNRMAPPRGVEPLFPG